MTAKFSTRAIVLSTEAFGESDCYVHFLTRDWGVISTLAKSAKKSKRRYVGGLDLFCHDEIFLRGDPKDRPYLLELAVINSFQGIRDSLERVMMAGKVAQWVKRLANFSTPMPQIYSLMGQTLAVIEKEASPERLELLMLLFKIKMLSQLGLKPRTGACGRCGTEEMSVRYFDLSAGGLLCGPCRTQSRYSEATPVDKEEELFLEHADDIKLSQWGETRFTQNKVPGLNRLVSQFASYHTHMRLPV